MRFPNAPINSFGVKRWKVNTCSLWHLKNTCNVHSYTQRQWTVWCTPRITDAWRTQNVVNNCNYIAACSRRSHKNGAFSLKQHVGTNGHLSYACGPFEQFFFSFIFTRIVRVRLVFAIECVPHFHTEFFFFLQIRFFARVRNVCFARLSCRNFMIRTMAIFQMNFD